jgi:phage terminase large subunit-like protein
VLEFFRDHLRHVKGELAGRPLVLAPWQVRDIVRPLFNSRRPDGLRRYRTCYIEIPRKNGKSSLAAGLALYLLYCDGEPGAEIVSAAADRQQAAITFDIARAMVEASPALRALTKIYRRELVVPSSGSIYRVISAEAYSKHGMNLHAAVVDELHAWPDRELLDVLATSMGGRRQPLLIVITTAGHDRHSVCWQMHEHAQKVRDGLIEDPSFLPVLYGAAPEDDWTDPEVWARANPGLGVTVKRDYLEQECRRAREMPAYEQAFRRWHLNVWTESETRWLSLEAWDACASASGLPGDDFSGGAAMSVSPRRAFLGLDLSSTTDLTALVILLPDPDGGWTVRAEFFCPSDYIAERSRRDRVPYELWRDQGYLTATPGNTVDYSFIEARIHELMRELEVVEVAVDPWNARGFVAKLQQDGIPAVEVPQTMANLTAASKELERLILSRRVRHDGHPILRWCVSNAVADIDGNGNVKPSKRRSTERIDGVSALVTALARALVVPVGSVYDERGPLLVEL